MNSKIGEWIANNLETANNLGRKGLAPIEMGDSYITFQEVGCIVEFSFDEANGILTRVDYLRETVSSHSYGIIHTEAK